MQNVKVIRIGLGEIISNWGTYEGKPALFLEPTAARGNPGDTDPEGLTSNDSVVPGGTIIQFCSSAGARVVMEDMRAALGEDKEHGSPNPKLVE